MNPLTLEVKAALLAAAVLALAGGGFGAGWFVNGALKDAEISQIRESQAIARADEAERSLQEFSQAAAGLRTSADQLLRIRKTLGAQIATLNTELTHAPPLPADCLPDALRVRTLDAAIDAANAAIIGQRPGAALPDD